MTIPLFIQTNRLRKQCVNAAEIIVFFRVKEAASAWVLRRTFAARGKEGAEYSRQKHIIILTWRVVYAAETLIYQRKAEPLRDTPGHPTPGRVSEPRGRSKKYQTTEGTPTQG